MTLVHVPRVPVTVDTRSRLYRFLHRQVCRAKAVFAQQGLPAPLEKILDRYRYTGRHHKKPGDKMETRVRDAQGRDTGERFHWVEEPTLRQKIAQARSQRARRRNLAAAWMHTGAFPVLEDQGWILRQRQAQRFASYAEAMQP